MMDVLKLSRNKELLLRVRLQRKDGGSSIIKPAVELNFKLEISVSSSDKSPAVARRHTRGWGSCL